ncbi:hypothetical protein CQP30_10940 [Yersinia pestis]|nr:hypothetical protein [Yersinia pestis]MRN86195.1 hypothetical protein [Yersinia pestis]MRN90281.1 hypothetical protein [Yersinia pestis]MRN94519.1 hypothetical protein [Yersinia pestis]MRN98631.1 hypothetical protein [Yersinia pestis]
MSRAISGADTLLFCLSSPFKIASSGFVSSLVFFSIYPSDIQVADVLAAGRLKKRELRASHVLGNLEFRIQCHGT